MVAVAVLLSYLAGSISFPYWIARLRGVELRTVGSRKLGGSNLWKSVGPGEAIVGGLLDAAKGFVAVVVARAIGLPLEAQLACGIAAIVGQMWPVFHGFDGGRANSAGWGFALAADPIAFVIMMLPVLAAIAMRLAVRPRPSRVLPLASLLSFGVFPAVIWEQDGTTAVVQAGFVVLALIVVRRITAGLGEDLATGAPPARVLANRALFDRTELQQRGVVGI
ncbi:MAG TPA: glycerol-3-phosphate acyltransferase [Candidatus Saccharimonadales bacterium]|nr:glycerol-3-phosphate acyltransferase [Candidatus Saccharimonadales bacterium]